ncbi:lipoprotein [Xanthobacter autotrophicus DSM 431]|uniref:LPS translocon maturation chaperone LptM n=1 Tax=Xanthobacter nonsaccharivorans TaxID=3119912 RepID=UPI0037269F55
MRPLRLLLALGATLAVAACGVKGPLEPPPGAHVAAPPPKQSAAATSDGYVAPKSTADLINSATPTAEWAKKKSSSSGSGAGSSGTLLQGVDRPKQPFILDGLL